MQTSEASHQQASSLTSLAERRAVPVSDRVATLPATTFWVVLMIILLGGAGLRAWNLGGADIWTDEVLTALRARASFSESLESILEAGNQAPVYYMLMRVLPHDSDLQLRIPSLVMGVINIAQLALIVSYLFQDRVLGLGAGALLAVSPLHIMLSRTARFYTLLMLLGLGVMLCFLLLLRDRRTRGVWVAFLVLSVMAYTTHYTSLMLPAAQVVLLMVTFPTYRSLFKPWIATQTLVLLPAAVWSAIGSSLKEYEDFEFISRLPGLVDLPLTLSYLLVGYDSTAWEWVMLPGVVVAMGALMLGVYRVLRYERSDHSRLFWAILGVLPVITFWAISVMFFSKYKDRYLLLVLPGMFLLVLWGLRMLPQRVRWAALALILATATYNAVVVYRSGDYERTAWSEAADYLADHYQPGDGVIFARWTTFEAFRTYYEGDHQLLDDGLLLSEVDATVDFESRSTRIWVVYRVQHEDFHRQGWVRDFDPFRRQVSSMSDWLIERRDFVLDVQTFDGVIVFLVDSVGLPLNLNKPGDMGP